MLQISIEMSMEYFSFIQADYLHPHLHGVIAYFNFVLLRVNCAEGNAKGKLVCTYAQLLHSVKLCNVREAANSMMCVT